MTRSLPISRVRLRLLPPDATADARLIVASRGVRAFGDGFVSVLLPLHLTTIGLSAGEVGLVTTATLFGSAMLTLLAGALAGRWRRHDLLVRASLLMVATGIGFAVADAFWPLMVVAFVGTLNPTSGDVSVFLPTELSLLPATAPDRERTALFARYTLVGALAAAVGSLAAGIPDLLTTALPITLGRALDAMFLLYAALGLVTLALNSRLSPRVEPPVGAPPSRLGPSRRAVYQLAALFSLDAFAGGFTMQSIIAFWLFLRFDLSTATAGLIFFWAGLLSAGSQLVAPVLARRIGLIHTMVFTHLPANVLLVLAALMPSVQLAVACLLARFALSQMDVPARTSYVMAVVTPPERPAAASVTNVPRSLAPTISPTLAGKLLGVTAFGWPLVIGGSLKIVYDLTLLVMFRHRMPPEEQASPRQ
jgi:MFS family permease